MSYRSLTPEYAVSPQIAPEDVTQIAAAGFTTLICNRPDAEVPQDLAARHIAAAAQAAGLTFVENPFSHQDFHGGLVNSQADAIASANGPVFAYCASGNRSSVLWAMAMVRAGKVTPEDAIRIAAEHGYNLHGLLDHLTGLAPDA